MEAAKFASLKLSSEMKRYGEFSASCMNETKCVALKAARNT